MAGDEPIDLLATCRALHSAIDRLDQRAADRLAVSRSDLRALNLLERESMGASALARALGLTTGSVTALVDRLEKRGLVRRAADPDDRRAVLVEPTAAMFRQLSPLNRAVGDAVARLAEGYEVEERMAAIRHLDDARAAFDAAVAVIGRKAD